MGRYIIDNPEPPGAMEQFRGNINRLGQTMLQLKMAELERKRKLEEDIAGEGRKMQGELGLLREKSKIEQESPLGMLEQRSKLASFIKDTGQEATPEQMEFLGINRPRTMTENPQVDINAPLSVNAPQMKSPVFGQTQGQMIPEGGTIENTPFGPRMKDMKVFSPEAKIIEKSITENVPAINKANTLESVYNNIEDLWLKTEPKEKGGIGMLTAGPYDYMAAGLQRNPKEIASKEYLDFIGGIRALLARGMGDVGNLSEYEQKAVIQSVPKIGPFGQDIKQTGTNKMANLRKVINDIKEARKQGMSLEAYQGNTGNKPVFNNQKTQQLEFSSEAEAEAANLPSGTGITINGRPAIWE